MAHLGTSASRRGTRITPTFFASRPPTPQLYDILFAGRTRWAWRVRNGPAPLLGQRALWPGAEGALPSGRSPETCSAGRWPRRPSDAPWRRDAWAPGAGAQAWQCQGYDSTGRSSDDRCVTVTSAGFAGAGALSLRPGRSSSCRCVPEWWAARQGARAPGRPSRPPAHPEPARGRGVGCEPLTDTDSSRLRAPHHRVKCMAGGDPQRKTRSAPQKAGLGGVAPTRTFIRSFSTCL